MYKYILEQAGNINWMALFSLVTFFVVFSITVILALRSDKKLLRKMANLPLEADHSLTSETQHYEK
jgi:hypothetical protein